MEASRDCDFLFCHTCGTLLTLFSAKIAKCNYCGFQKKAKKIVGRETCYTVSAADIRRELGIEAFVKLDGYATEKEEVVRRTAKEVCTKCGHPELYFTSKQIRSADEGSTIFYECPNCGHSHNVNN